jgi:hypothetical protein
MELCKHGFIGWCDNCACHVDCGPITLVTEIEHRHENEDGSCWHDNDDLSTDQLAKMDRIDCYILDMEEEDRRTQ